MSKVSSIIYDENMFDYYSIEQIFTKQLIDIKKKYQLSNKLMEEFKNDWLEYMHPSCGWDWEELVDHYYNNMDVYEVCSCDFLSPEEISEHTKINLQKLNEINIRSK
tara:strand:- start:1417 stop:1737 length:321 start_codon:yes stop_codon:yes gene_type:complete